jgi:hypothetical protein
MTPKKASHRPVRPLRVFVGHKTKAEVGFRKRSSMPDRSVIAPGLPETPDHDLIYNGGYIIQDLVFTNFYVGGTAAWQASDMQSIDQALAAALSDPGLNNVMSQYYSSGKITSTFQPSQVLAGPPPQTVSQGDVENLVRTLFQAGSLSGYDYTSTVFNFMLPSGTILTTDPAPTTSTIAATIELGSSKPRVAKSPVGIPVEEDEDSTQGLGGYHGSIHVITASSTQTLYYAVGVYSEQLPDGTTNGIPVFDQPWKNVVATFYHELNEARTDPDVEDAIKAGNDPSAAQCLGWVSSEGEECGDFPVAEANPLSQVFQEVELTDQSGTVPVQFQYSDADHGPGEPRDTPAPFAGQVARARVS